MEEIILSTCLGIGLSAACGFRVFIPFLVMSLASRSDHLVLSDGFDWIASDAALLLFAVATVLEIAAYYVPWLDNLLDGMAAPVAVVAGILATAAAVQGSGPLVTWTLAVIGGGGAAGLVQTATTVLRGASSVMTAGFGNALVSTAEAGGALTLSALAVTLPLLAVLVLLSAFLGVAIRVLSRGQTSRSPTERENQL